MRFVKSIEAGRNRSAVCRRAWALIVPCALVLTACGPTEQELTAARTELEALQLRVVELRDQSTELASIQVTKVEDYDIAAMRTHVEQARATRDALAEGIRDMQEVRDGRARDFLEYDRFASTFRFTGGHVGRGDENNTEEPDRR